MIGRLGLDGPVQRSDGSQNAELSWLNREAHKQKRAGAFSNSSLLDGLQTVRYSLRKSHAVSQIGNIKPKVR